MNRFNFNKPLIESPYPPKNINALWVKSTSDNALTIYEYKKESHAGYWTPIKRLVLPRVNENTIQFTSTTCPNIINADLTSATYTDQFGIIEFKDTVTLNDIFKNSTLTSIRLPENLNIASIPDYTFLNCSLLSHFTIPNTVTSIGNYAFYGCSSLTSITIPDSVTSIGSSAFSGCASLKSVRIPENVTNIASGAFSNCTRLKSVNIPKSFTYIATSLFSGTNLTSINLHDNITDIQSGAFADCPLQTITLPKNVVSIGSNAFSNCGLIDSLYIPKSVTQLDSSAFRLTTFNTIVVDPENTYYDSRDNCNAIIETANNELFIGSNATDTNNIPESITTINSYAFYGCTKQKSIKVHKNISFFGGGEALTNSAITSVYWDTNLVGSHGYYTTFGSHSSKITHLEFGPNVTRIIGRMCENMINLKSVTLPDSIIEIEWDAFKNSGILELTIPKNVTDINSQAFRGLTLYKDKFINNSTLDAEANNYWGLTLVSEIINGYGILDGLLMSYPLNELNIVIPNKVVAIQSYLFTNNVCTITIPESVIWIGTDAFYNSLNLNKTNYTGDIASWCGITFENKYANPIYRSHNLYINNKEVTDLVIPNSVTTISNYAFNGCSSLTSIVIPDNVTSIGEKAFHECYNINTVTIGTGLQSIGDNAFYSLNSSSTIYYKGTEEQWQAIPGTSNIYCNVIYNA